MVMASFVRKWVGTIEFPDGINVLFFDSPDLFQKIVKNRIMFLELGADEGIEVVSIKVDCV